MQEFFNPAKWAVFLDPGIWAFLWTGLQITLAMAADRRRHQPDRRPPAGPLPALPLPLLRYPAAFYVEVVRALPVLLIIFFTFFGASRAGFGLNPFGAGALALALYTSAINAEIVRAGITSISPGSGRRPAPSASATSRRCATSAPAPGPAPGGAAGGRVRSSPS